VVELEKMEYNITENLIMAAQGSEAEAHEP
jgi:hypothetical protein